MPSLTPSSPPSASRLTPLQAATELLQRRRARRSLKDFWTYTTPHLVVGRAHEALFKELEDILAGRNQFLMVWLPPQHGKSWIVSRRLPAYVIGREPHKFVTMASYEKALATEFGGELRNLVESQDFRNVFPAVALRQDSKAAGRWNTEQGGGFFCAGVDSGMVGRGSDFGIVDDPHKDRKEADSKVMRARVQRWWQGTFVTRQHENAPIIVCQTRWHHDDLCGWLLKQADAKKWKVLHLPAVAEKDDPLGRDPGSALFPERYSLAFLDATKTAIGEEEFAAQYQGEPSIKAGKIFRRERWGFWTPETLPSNFDVRIVFNDVNVEEGDDNSENAMAYIGIVGNKYYWLDLLSESQDFDAQVATLKEFCLTHFLRDGVVVEKKANGAAVIISIQDEVGGVIAYNPGTTSKEQRAKAAMPAHAAGNIYLPADRVAHPWVDKVIQQCAEFPHGDLDDIVDLVSMSVGWWKAERVGEVGDEAQQETSIVIG